MPKKSGEKVAEVFIISKIYDTIREIKMEVYMHYIRNMTKFLIIITILYIVSFKISLHLNILNEDNKAIMINLMTGFATSALISFVEYNIRLQENIGYFISDLIWYYRTLFRLKRRLDSSISINEKI